MSSMTRPQRSGDDLVRDPAFIAAAARAFPSLAEALSVRHDRRSVMKLMAAGLALAGLGGCDDGEPGGVLIPPVLPSRGSIARGSNVFATASLLQGYAAGVLVSHSLGRPIKVEGNPDHPGSLGATDAISQAEILGFYDPDRTIGVMHGGVQQDWHTLQTTLAQQRDQINQTHGEGFRVLTGATTSPTLVRLIEVLLRRYPQMQWHQWEPISRDAVRAGAMLAYGRPVEVVPELSAADVILAIDSDLLSSAPGHVRFALAFAMRRNPVRTPAMSRWYAIEPAPTLTGVAADHRFVAGTQDMHRIVLGLADMVLRGLGPPTDAPLWLAGLAADLKAHHGRVLIHVGPHQPAEFHALAHAMNEMLGGRGNTYHLIEAVAVSPTDQSKSLHDLAADMASDRVQSLLIVDSNPVFTALQRSGFPMP